MSVSNSTNNNSDSVSLHRHSALESAPLAKQAQTSVESASINTTDAQRKNRLAMQMYSLSNSVSIAEIERPSINSLKAAPLTKDELVEEFITLWNDEKFTEEYVEYVNAFLGGSLEDFKAAEDALDKFLAKNFEAIHTHLTETLGYGSFQGFMELLNATPGAIAPDGSFTDIGSAEIVYRIGLPFDAENAFEGSVDGAGKLPQVDSTATFVSFTLKDGSRVSFDGPGAGRAANDFSIAYNNSETFQNTMHFLSEQQGGQYAFHMFDQSGAGGSSFTAGFNYMGTDTLYSSSGVYLNDPANLEGMTFMMEYSLLGTLIHEVGHDLHDCACHGAAPDTGSSHSREHTMFIGNIINEIENSGIDTGVDVDDDDYTNDISLFGAQSDIFKEGSNLEPINHIRIDEMSGEEINRFDEISDTYTKIQQAINDGDYGSALDLMSLIPANETMDFAIPDPQGIFASTVETYNVREIIVQELLLQSDSDDWLNSDKGTNLTNHEKASLLSFIDAMKAKDPDFQQTVDNAAEALNMDLAIELKPFAGMTLDSVANGAIDRHDGTGVTDKDGQLGKWELYSAGITDLSQNKFLRRAVGDKEGRMSQSDLADAMHRGLIEISSDGAITLTEHGQSMAAIWNGSQSFLSETEEIGLFGREQADFYGDGVISKEDFSNWDALGDSPGDGVIQESEFVNGMLFDVMNGVGYTHDLALYLSELILENPDITSLTQALQAEGLSPTEAENLSIDWITALNSIKDAYNEFSDVDGQPGMSREEFLDLLTTRFEAGNDFYIDPSIDL